MYKYILKLKLTIFFKHSNGEVYKYHVCITLCNITIISYEVFIPTKTFFFKFKKSINERCFT